MKNKWFDVKNGRTKITEIVKSPFDFIVIGEDPSRNGMSLDTARRFDIYLNVSNKILYSKDKGRPRFDIKYFHVPINEDEFWGYEPFFETKKILDDAYLSRKKVYLHCEEGANRSPTIAAFWIYSRVGNFDKALDILTNNPEIHKRRITYYQSKNKIPSELEEFYKRYEKFGRDLERILKTKPEIRNDLKAIS